MKQDSNKTDIIIDTDCAVDDLRAITMLLALQEVNIKAIITSDGTLSPEMGVLKVATLLKTFKETGIPIGIGQKFNNNPPFWREFNSKVFWGEAAPNYNFTGHSAGEVLHKVFAEAKNKIILVCLGPLSNIAQFLKQFPGYIAKISHIIWYIETVYPHFNGSNFDTDINSAEQLLYSEINIFCISSLGKSSICIDSEYISAISSINTIYGNAILNSFISPGMDEKLRTCHLKLWDDFVPLFMVAPQYFKMNVLSYNRHVFYTVDYNLTALKKKIFSILSGTYKYKSETLDEYSKILTEQFKT